MAGTGVAKQGGVDGNETLFDFLYSDHERVAALISQIEGVGNLIGYERVSGKQMEDSHAVSGSLKVLSSGKSTSSNLNRQLRQDYDPLWTNSKKLIKLINTSDDELPVDDYKYGKILTVSGKVLCMDQAIFNNILKSPSIINQIASGMDSDKTNRSSKSKQKNKTEIAGIIREFIQSIPLGIIFILFTDNNAFWFNVKREFLQLQSLDIPLKFPVQIGGTWHVTGIIDALPQDYAELADDVTKLGEKRVLPGAFETITSLITPRIALFGRPGDAYGLSPLTIHREIEL
ncbi:MAG: hypothetical protein WA954_12535 [Parerythrobacter sp.]